MGHRCMVSPSAVFQVTTTLASVSEETRWALELIVLSMLDGCKNFQCDERHGIFGWV